LNALARGLDEDDVARLCADGSAESVARRDTIALDGPTLVIVIEGWFRIFRTAAFVRDVTLGVASAGDVLGPTSLFGMRAAESGAEALAAGRILRLSPERWRAHATAEPELYLKLSGSVGRRVSRVQRKIEAQSRAGVEARVAESLVELGDDFGIPTAGGLRLDVPLSQEDLARLAGTTRETCSSTVAAFARRGLVRGGRLRGMTIVDRAGLAALAPASL
jgi:CRP-like cAMP-binding protein